MYKLGKSNEPCNFWGWDPIAPCFLRNDVLSSSRDTFQVLNLNDRTGKQKGDGLEQIGLGREKICLKHTAFEDLAL